MEFWKYATGIGLVATLAMDAWCLLRRRLLGTPLPNYGFVGRWLGHMASGRFRHDAIAAAPRVRGEQLIGWSAHYLVGIGFAAFLLAACGLEWGRQPTPWPALAVGLGTVALPFLVMQPAMGAGIAARRTARPGAARLQSVVTHAVFGAGLYLGGCIASTFQAM
ncbi:MAG: DUF2938 domain-containing protein [Burkholderiales bacterium]|nr:MAG: DUF2938 domain-containing protein [Burkholderiales bacterium]